MEKFNIVINTDVVASFKEINLWMEPGRDVMDVAEKLSIAYPNHAVHVIMHARIRRVYVNGKCINSNPTITKFYSETDENIAQMEWDWTCLGQVKD